MKLNRGNEEFVLMEQTDNFEHFLKILPPINSNPKIAFSGTLGIGKTHLIREYVASFDPQMGEQVQSPSYAYYYQYSGKSSVFHFDLYRVNQLHDLMRIGFWEVVEDAFPCFVEWAELFEPALHACSYWVKINVNTHKKRHYQLLQKI